jgi:hypothetical protein
MRINSEEVAMKRAYALMLITAVALIGCAEPEPEEPEGPPPPPPPTPQELADKVIQDAQLNAPLPPPGSRMPPAAAQNLLGLITREKTAKSATEDGKVALALVSRALERRIQEAEQRQLWEFVVVYIDAFGILNPGSARYESSKQRATVELLKPQPKIRGFIADGRTGETLVMLELYLPQTGETVQERMRIGEEIYGLRLNEIIGNNKGIVMRYVATGQTFEVMKDN